MYLSAEDRAAYEGLCDAERAQEGRQPAVWTHARLRVHFLERDAVAHLRSSAKYLPALAELTATNDDDDDDEQEQAERQRPLVVLDDDHWYAPSLLSTLLSAHIDAGTVHKVAFGGRGWRIRPDLHWGVTGSLYDDHVLQSYALASPTRVGVLTGNEAYLLLPSWIDSATVAELMRHDSDARRTGSGKETTALHLADDILIAGLLSQAGVSRAIAPLPCKWPSLAWLPGFLTTPSSGVTLTHAPQALACETPNVDVTRSHPLERHLAADGLSRAEANNLALAHFDEAWSREMARPGQSVEAYGLWYESPEERHARKEARAHEPVLASTLVRLVRFLQMRSERRKAAKVARLLRLDQHRMWDRWL